MKKIFITFSILFSSLSFAQELYIISPAAASVSKNRLELRNNIVAFDNFRYYHNSFDINYGITGKLTAYMKAYYTTNKDYKFLGSIEPMARYRFYDIDYPNSHFRFASQLGTNIPLDPKEIGNQVEYELHPGHVVSFFEFADNITVPIIDFHATDNYVLKPAMIFTALFNKLAISADAGYNVTIPKGDFKFGNYHAWGLSAGYLLLPREYKSFDDVNLNLYVENRAFFFERNKFLGEEIRNSGGFRFDTYLGIQSIWMSSLIIEAAYKIPAHSNEFTETKIQKRPPAIQFSIRYLFFP
jgi:hypothetical protein